MRLDFIFYAVIFVAVAGCNGAYQYGTKDTVQFTVQEKDRVVTGSGDTTSSKYLVYSEEGEVFENTDAFLQWKFDSSNLHAKLKVGRVCEAEVYGWRVPFLSMYRNLVEVDCAE